MKTATSHELQARMDQFRGGSDGRYRHPFNLRFIYTEGVRAVADLAGAYWLLDIIATEVAPLCMTRWSQFGDSPHFFKVEVVGQHAKLSLVRDTGEQPLWFDYIEYTDFPEGVWTFEMAVDGTHEPDFDVVVMALMQEH